MPNPTRLWSAMLVATGLVSGALGAVAALSSPQADLPRVGDPGSGFFVSAPAEALAPGDGAEHARFRALRVALAPAPPGEVSGADLPGILTLPATWRRGGPAVVLLLDGPALPGVHDRLVAGLIGQGDAVLELQAQEQQLPALFGALVALRHDHGAGWVAAIGVGAAADAALAALDPQVAADFVGHAGPRLAAAIALDEGLPDFARSERETAQAGAPLHLRRLCRAVGEAMQPAAEARCRASLTLPPPSLSLGVTAASQPASAGR